MTTRRRLCAVIVCLIWVGAARSAARAAEPTTREAFLKLIDRPLVEPAPSVSDDGTQFSFAAEAGGRVPGILVKPADAKDKRLPVVIVLHGTGGTKESVLPLMRKLAERGFLAVAIDGRYHGARTKAGKGSAEYQQAILRAWREPGREHPFFF